MWAALENLPFNMLRYYSHVRLTSQVLMKSLHVIYLWLVYVCDLLDFTCDHYIVLRFRFYTDPTWSGTPSPQTADNVHVVHQFDWKAEIGCGMCPTKRIIWRLSCSQHAALLSVRCYHKFLCWSFCFSHQNTQCSSKIDQVWEQKTKAHLVSTPTNLKLSTHTSILSSYQAMLHLYQLLK